MTYKHDFAVVGAGIAGIAIAELLQRSGKKVVLLEAEDKLGSASSSEHQSWFHTGALYAAFPTNEFFKLLTKNIDYLLSYYRGFPNMNLGYGHPICTTNLEGWFYNSLTYYYYVNPAEKEIPLWKKPLWYLATLVAQSRLAWFQEADFAGDVNSQMSGFMLDRRLNKAKSKRTFDFLFDNKITALTSYDRPLNSRLIMNDLVNSFLHSGGEIKLSSKVTKIGKEQLVVIEKSNQEVVYCANHIVLTTGRHSGEMIQHQEKIKVVKSPMLVVVPALSDVNFVRLSINASRIINHFYHEIPEGGYSVLGNAEYYGAGEVIDTDTVKSAMLHKANNFFGGAISASNASLYFGYKTELPGVSQLRNYKYQILESGHCILALPGKLSFAFSLAVECCRYYGIDPPVRVPLLDGEQPIPISEPLHKVIASRIYHNRAGA